MDELSVERRLAEVNGRARANSARIEKLESLVSAIHRQNENIAALVVELRHLTETVSTHEGRLGSIERRADRRMDTIFRAVVTALAGGLIGAALTVFLSFNFTS